ncbi:DNA polymerase III subunit epsilon [Psychrosphaera sp. B3R10]|uniref:exonuclease domain-containing protein n=1 Tax=unclassified Psychrosphaera TaxID=2641570 RepID=UPI001C08F417|nr:MULTISPECIES: exonuclease domain-containing protein [unclassified Psychrosphaera]MBU2880647.1 DNA polymerase III subunit epsilon [Psychrosphaera sp. I2R16]MBU2990733.1 DNA polymerase III subunit epsilon [Psychrosphaera sp. B3R10]
MWPFFESFLSAEQQRKRALRRVPEGALKEYLSVPFPDKNATISELTLLSVDFETTGLNAMTHQLLSIGSIEIDGGKIKLASSCHNIIKTKGKLEANNVVVHQITDSEKEQGIELKTAVDQLLLALAGKVMLVHYAKIERQFLRQVCFELYGVRPPLMMIDTLLLAKKRLDIGGQHYDPSIFRLESLRQSFQLPSYHAHNALNDAIATSELFLAEINKYKQGVKTKIRQLLCSV